MEQTIFINEISLIEFLKKNGIEAILTNQADEYHLYWWKREGINGEVEVAISGGYFFLAIKEENIGLFVHYERDDWYNLVYKWDTNISEDAFLYELSNLVKADDSYIWMRVRRTSFDSEWDNLISDIKKVEDISAELKEKIFQFSEGLVEFPKRIKELQKAILELLTFFANKDALAHINCLMMYKYFPFDKYQRWGLPDNFKLIINKMSKQFHNGNIPKQDEINKLLQEAKSLIN